MGRLTGLGDVTLCFQLWHQHITCLLFVCQEQWGVVRGAAEWSCMLIKSLVVSLWAGPSPFHRKWLRLQGSFYSLHWQNWQWFWIWVCENQYNGQQKHIVHEVPNKHFFFCLFLQSAKPFCVKTPTFPPQSGPRRSSQVKDQPHPTPPCPPFPTGAKMATIGAPRLSLPLLLPVTSLLLSLLLTGSHALCKYQDVDLQCYYR